MTFTVCNYIILNINIYLLTIHNAFVWKIYFSHLEIPIHYILFCILYNTTMTIKDFRYMLLKHKHTSHTHTHTVCSLFSMYNSLCKLRKTRFFSIIIDDDDEKHICTYYYYAWNIKLWYRHFIHMIIYIVNDDLFHSITDNVACSGCGTNITQIIIVFSDNYNII